MIAFSGEIPSFSSRFVNDLQETRVRNRCLLLTLVLLGGETPLHASLGVAPQCNHFLWHAAETAAAKSPVPELHPGLPNRPQVQPLVPNYDAEDRDYMIRTIAYEAADEPEEGKAAVAHVILNRQRTGRWGPSIREVVMDPWQFEPWMTRRKEVEALSPSDPRYRDAALNCRCRSIGANAGSNRGGDALPQS